MSESTIKKFLADLAATEAGTLRELLRFQLQLAMKIQAQVQDNIKANFGQGHGAKSPITERGYGSTARRAGRGGGLFGSVNLERGPDGSPTVSAGGPGVPYAAIHELGGVVVPTHAEFLTIPFQSKYSGARAREFPLRYGVDPIWGRVLVQKSAPDPGEGSYASTDIAYLLRRKATIPARPYFRPAVDKVTQLESVREVMKKLLGSSKLGVYVV